MKKYSKTDLSTSPKIRVIKQVLKPDLSLIADISLAPGTEPVMLVLPGNLPVEEVQEFEKFVRKIDEVKIVIIGGSSDKGYNIGIQVLKPLDLSAVLSASNMIPIKRVHKNGEKIFLATKNTDSGIKNTT